MSRKRRKKKKNKNNGGYCPSILIKDKKRKGELTPLEFSFLCNKIKIGVNKVEVFNY